MPKYSAAAMEFWDVFDIIIQLIYWLHKCYDEPHAIPLNYFGIFFYLLLYSSLNRICCTSDSKYDVNISVQNNNCAEMETDISIFFMLQHHIWRLHMDMSIMLIASFNFSFEIVCTPHKSIYVCELQFQAGIITDWQYNWWYILISRALMH